MEPISEPPPLLPPPPPPTLGTPPAAHPAEARRPRLPGQLTQGWNTVFWLSWAGVTAGLAAVWYSSRITGFATWWLGPETAPRFVVVSMLPFVAPIALCVLALSHRRWLPWGGIGGAFAIALVGVGDLGTVRGYGYVELVLAAGGLLVSVASFAGMLRSVAPDAATG